MRLILTWFLACVIFSANGQQGQNYYFSNSEIRQQGRFIPFQSNQQHPSQQQVFSNYFPQTNAGPFSPYRGTAPSYQIQRVQLTDESLPTSTKFQQFPQQFVSQPAAYQLPPHSSSPSPHIHYDPSAVSPAVEGYAKHDNYQNSNFRISTGGPISGSGSFHNARPTAHPPQRYQQANSNVVLRNNQIPRFQEPVAFSEVSRIHGDGSGEKTTQNYLNVQHSPVSPDELPVYEENDWNTGEAAPEQDNNYQGRNVQLPQRYNKDRSNKKQLQSIIDDPTTEDVFVHHGNRFYVKEPTIAVLDISTDRMVSKYHSTPESSYEFSGSVLRLEDHDGSSGILGNNENVKNENVQHKVRSKTVRVKSNSYPQPTTYTPSSSYFPENYSSAGTHLDRFVKTTKAPSSTSTTNLGLSSSFSPAGEFFTRSEALAKNIQNNRVRNKVSKVKIETDHPSNLVESSTEHGRDSIISSSVHSETEDHLNNTSSQDHPISNFDVVTMAQNHAFVSEDNFKGFVDSGLIDITEIPLSTEEPKELFEDISTTVPIHNSPVVKKNLLSADKKRSEESTTKQLERFNATTVKSSPSTLQSSTEGWIVVASVQTSRSVSGARFIPSTAIKQGHLHKNGNKLLQERASSTPIATGKRLSSTSETTTVSMKPSTSTENIIDKLDQVQSELSSGILDGGFPSHEKLTMDIIPDVLSGVSTSTTKFTSTTSESSEDDEQPSRKFVPSAKRTTTKPKIDSNKVIFENIQFDELTNLLPPGYKARGFTPKGGPAKNGKMQESTTSVVATTTEKNTTRNKDMKNKSTGISALKHKIKFDDVSAFLPPDYKHLVDKEKQEKEIKEKSSLDSDINNSTENTSEKIQTKLSSILDKIKPVDVSSFVPPDYKEPSSEKSPTIDSLLGKIKFKETNDLIPADYQNITSTETSVSSTTNKPDSKVVFPSRPPGSAKKPQAKPSGLKPGILPHQVPVIQKGWPVRASTEFQGWSTASPSPISIEKLLQAAKEASAAKEISDASSVFSTTTEAVTTTTAPTTTTPKPTTPGFCSQDCELAGTIKLVGGATWVPELLDHNTKEWQTLANDVQRQLESVYQNSEALSRWYQKITIDAFSQGSIVVDYFVELSDLGRTVNTADMKRLFKDTLVQEAISNGDTFILTNSSNRKQLKFGKFSIDPSYIDFVVLPKIMYPVVGMQEQDMWLPQWAIAVIVIGMASLLFVVIFGITVLVNRQKNALKHPTTLTEDMLNELNKNHMSGCDNYGADDLYNMEDVWNEKPIKKRSSYYQEGSIPNIYDSWRSDWNGYYGNSYYNGSTHSGYSRRRSDYDTNF